MPVLNDRALRPLYRKAGRALGQLNQRIDRWTRRYPTTTAVLFALLGWVLLWLAPPGAIWTWRSTGGDAFEPFSFGDSDELSKSDSQKSETPAGAHRPIRFR